MAKGNLAACLAITLKHEGGWSDHPKDPGGATMKGVTLATYRSYYPGATKEQLRNITSQQVEKIYADGYWNKVSGDALPFGVDLTVFDYGVNSGPSRGVKALQAVLGVKQDGKAGNDTILHAAKADGKTVIQKICARRMSFLQGLTTWQTFKGGWSRRVADIEAKAVAMWLSRGGDNVKPMLEAEAEAAKNTAANQNKSAGGAAAGGGGVIGGDTFTTGDINWLLVGGILVAVIVVAGVLLLKARHNKERAAAYQAVASAR